MEKLIIVRHGDYDKDSSHLNDKGSADIKQLAEQIRPLTDSHSVLVLSSPIDRAIESALILSNTLHVPAVYCDALRSECQGDMDLDGALSLIHEKSDMANIIVVVTHIEYTDNFPAHFFKHEFNTKAPYMHLEKGEAAIIDCASRTLTKVA